MRGKNTLVINGKVYDAITGLAVAAPDKVVVTPKKITHPETFQTIVHPKSAGKARASHHAASTHLTTQKSATLRRDVLKKPAVKAHASLRRKPSTGHVSRSEQIQRFAPHPQPLKTAAVRPTTGRQTDIASARTSSMISRTHAATAKKSPEHVTRPTLSSRTLKEQLIAERLASVGSHSSGKTTSSIKSKPGLFSRLPRIAHLVVVSFTVMVLGGYFTYLNMPGLSVRVAAAQADVAANYPDYRPDGYRFEGPVAFAPGQVAISFKATGGNTGYTVTEQKSSWDSQAVYDNVVAKVANDKYVTNSQQGLTIYTFGGEAAWVNRGILYTIEGDAPLNNQQLLRIAASL